jgi:O-antigen/teichoic acid export membrane protein
VGTVRGSFLLSLLDSYLGVALQLASAAIVSRLLTPAEVGVFAIAAVFSALASTFRDFGVAEYLIQEKQLTNEKIRAALALNIAISWSMAVTLALLAPLAAVFYEDAGVRDVLLVLALSFLLVPFGAVTMAWFRRELNYRPIVIGNALSSVASFVAAVWLALLGYGYMSLAWSTVVGIVVSVAAANWFRPAGFPLRPSLQGIAEVFHFGKFASGIYIFDRLGKGAPELIIGKTGGVVDVGIFSRGNGVVEVVHRLVMRPVMQVCLPYFARSDRETGSLLPAYLRSVSLVTAVGWPVLGVLAVTAYAAIRLIYGAQWTAATPLAQLLCIALAIELPYALSREAVLARGDARSANSLQVKMVVTHVVGLLASIPYGLLGACWGLVAAAAVSNLVAHAYLRSTMRLRAQDLWTASRKSLFLTAWVVSPVALASIWCPADDASKIIWGLGSAGVAAALWLTGLRIFRHELWDEIAAVVRHRWRDR